MAEKEMDYFTALYDVARVINASLEPSQVLDEIVRSVAETMNVKASSLRLLDKRRNRLALGARYGLSDAYIHKGPVLVEESGLDREALQGVIIWVKDAQTDPRFQYKEMARAGESSPFLSFPSRRRRGSSASSGFTRIGSANSGKRRSGSWRPWPI
jgi:signal transduction protein with GAF and PtsI domain